MIELVIKISEKAYNALTHTEFDANLVVDEMRKAIVNGTPLSKNPTNGDVIKAMFPNVRIIEMPEVGVIEVHDGLLGESRNFSWEWWYTPYKEVKADDKRRSDS